MKKKWLVVAGVVLVAALMGWLIIGPSRKGDTVEILGDSITEVSNQVLRAGLSDYTLNIQAMGGLRTDQLQAAADQGATSHPKQVIINLGTNDVLQGRGVDQFKASLEKMISTFGSADCIHVVTLNTHMVTASGSNEALLQSANHAIGELVGQHPNVDRIDWNKIVEASDDHAGKETITFDSIHPNLKGQLLLAHAYADALKNCGRPVLFHAEITTSYRKWPTATEGLMPAHESGWIATDDGTTGAPTCRASQWLARERWSGPW